ncbi:Mediator of RNA polymerase II transcription subunit 8 [Zea mays]|uniref:Mediator of RNA polymerase II transcription subunit 8 n=1 Tax=Zea mays TaxID=4577 RepID=A0A1D6LPB8_MAIZE|nr:Mediator of RNA polymerase II transcription subunit 8 [Zea mays]
MEKCRSVPHEHSSPYYGGGGGGGPGQAGKSYSFNGPSGRDDPEPKRRRRVAAYNVLAAQGRIKTTVRGSVKCLKSKISPMSISAVVW